MKKFITAILFATMLVLPAAPAFAQTTTDQTTYMTQADLDAKIQELRLQLIDLITQYIAILQAQLDAEKARTTSLENDVKELKASSASNQAPAPAPAAAPEPAPAPVPTPSLTVENGTPSVSLATDEAGVKTGTYMLPFTLSAHDGDQYVPTDVAAALEFKRNEGDLPASTNATFTGSAQSTGGLYLIPSGTSATFTLTIVITPTERGSYGFVLSGVNHTVNADGSSLEKLPASVRTDSYYYQPAGSVTE